MFKVHTVARKNPRNHTTIYGLAAAPVQAVGLNHVTARIARESTVSSADVKAVLDSLQHVIIDELARGNSVRLGDLGSFRPTISAKTHATSEAVSMADIKRVRVQFSPGAEMRRSFNKDHISFTQIKL